MSLGRIAILQVLPRRWLVGLRGDEQRAEDQRNPPCQRLRQPNRRQAVVLGGRRADFEPTHFERALTVISAKAQVTVSDILMSIDDDHGAGGPFWCAPAVSESLSSDCTPRAPNCQRLKRPKAWAARHQPP